MLKELEKRNLIAVTGYRAQYAVLREPLSEQSNSFMVD
jgi:hypothetical protein